jgi:hypothetical protein
VADRFEYGGAAKIELFDYIEVLNQRRRQCTLAQVSPAAFERGIGGTLIAMYFSASFSIGAWYTGTILLVFADLGRRIVNHEYRANAHAAERIRPPDWIKPTNCSGCDSPNEEDGIRGSRIA